MSALPFTPNAFGFIEFNTPDPTAMERHLKAMGFAHVANNTHRHVMLMRQGSIDILLNAEDGHFAQRFTVRNGPTACGYALCVSDAEAARGHALQQQGVQPYGRRHPLPVSTEEADDDVEKATTDKPRVDHTPLGSANWHLPAIRSVGYQAMYFIDAKEVEQDVYRHDFQYLGEQSHTGLGLTAIDHIAHNGATDWEKFYRRVLGFTNAIGTDDAGHILTSENGHLRVSLPSATTPTPPPGEFDGHAMPYIGFLVDDITAAVGAMRQNGVTFQDPPDSYYDALEARLPGHRQDMGRLRSLRLMLDGRPGDSLVLRAVTSNTPGTTRFVLVQRV